MKQTHVGIIAVSFILLLLFGLFFAFAETTPVATTANPTTIAGWIKLINANIVGAGTAANEVKPNLPVPQTKDQTTGALSSQPVVYGNSALVEIKKNTSSYSVIFRSGFDPIKDYVCVPTSIGNYKEVVDVASVDVCLGAPFQNSYNPFSGEAGLTNGIIVWVNFKDSKEKLISQHVLDCYHWPGQIWSWKPSSNSSEKCDLDDFDPTLSNFITMSSATGVISDGAGKFNLDFSFITNGATSYPGR